MAAATKEKTTELRAYHGDEKLKEETVAKARMHKEASEFVRNEYFSRNGKTKVCAVGCITEDPSGGHHLYPTRWGIPEWLAYLEEKIFTGLADEKMAAWPERFLDAIPVGADFDGLADRLAIRRLKEECLSLSGSWPESIRAEVVASIEQTIAALEGKGDRSAARSAAESAAWSAESSARSAAESSAWSAESAAWSAESSAWSAESSARSAAESSAWSAESSARSAESSAWSAARSAARSAESSAWSAARSSAWSAESAAWSAESSARSAARSAAFEREADRLIAELDALPVREAVARDRRLSNGQSDRGGWADALPLPKRMRRRGRDEQAPPWRLQAPRGGLRLHQGHGFQGCRLVRDPAAPQTAEAHRAQARLD